jgi:hypothetical protein
MLYCRRNRPAVFALWAIVVGAGCKAPPPQAECTSETVAPIAAEELPLVQQVRDPVGDYILDHPLFERVFDVTYSDNRVIPQALDIVQVEVSAVDGHYVFELRTQAGDIAAELRRADQRASYGVYIDRDGNGASDLLLTTTAQLDRGVIVAPDFELVSQMRTVELVGNVIRLQVPEEMVGEAFDWLAFSGYSPIATAFHPTPLESVFFVPVVDVVLPDEGRMREILTSYSGDGACQVYQSQYHSCPPYGSPPLVPVPGTSYQGVLISSKQCGARGHSLWCIAQSFFGKRVVEGANQGWVAKCPFPCGFNEQDSWDVDQDGLPDIVYHTVTDADCGSTTTDKDGDGLRDIMKHEYEYAGNLVESCNVERNPQTGGLVAERCCAPRKPYANPALVPGAITGSPPDYNCPQIP